MHDKRGLFDHGLLSESWQAIGESHLAGHL